MTNETKETPEAEYLNGNGIYNRFAIPRSLLRELVNNGRVRMRDIQSQWGVMHLYNVADCAAVVNGTETPKGGAQ